METRYETELVYNKPTRHLFVCFVCLG